MHAELGKAASFSSSLSYCTHPDSSLQLPTSSRAGASHSSFVDGGPFVNAAADLLCGQGSDTRKEVAELTALPLLAWLYGGLVTPDREQSGDMVTVGRVGQSLTGEHGGRVEAGCAAMPVTWIFVLLAGLWRGSIHYRHLIRGGQSVFSAGGARGRGQRCRWRGVHHIALRGSGSAA